MKIESVLISKLSEDKKNARKHDKKNIDAICGSLKKFGQQKPIVVDKNGIILAGNGTFQAAKKLKWKSIDVVRTELEGDEAKAYALADNRTQELSVWDDELLSKSLAELCEIDFDIGSIGFDESFVKGHLRENKNGEIEDDEVPEIQKNIHNVQRGQVWKLGNHRLVCGDSTNEADVSKLMDGQKADMVFTDPPYGIDVGNQCQGKGGGVAKKNNYGINNWDKEIPYKAIELARTLSDSVILWGANYYADKLPPSSCWIIWDKDNGETDFADAELAWTSFNKSVRLFKWKWMGMIQQDMKNKEERVHPTQKPVALAEWCLDKFGKSGDNVVDLFGGSGSTLVACEKTKRKCFMMELDEHYCSVIIERWQKFTGLKATLITGN